jgi:hypothetical protein
VLSQQLRNLGQTFGAIVTATFARMGDLSTRFAK